MNEVKLSADNLSVQGSFEESGDDSIFIVNVASALVAAIDLLNVPAGYVEVSEALQDRIEGITGTSWVQFFYKVPQGWTESIDIEVEESVKKNSFKLYCREAELY